MFVTSINSEEDKGSSVLTKNRSHITLQIQKATTKTMRRPMMFARKNGQLLRSRCKQKIDNQ